MTAEARLSDKRVAADGGTALLDDGVAVKVDWTELCTETHPMWITGVRVQPTGQNDDDQSLRDLTYRSPIAFLVHLLFPNSSSITSLEHVIDNRILVA